MVDFLRHLPRERREALRRRIDAEAREAARLHALPDRWLAKAVIDLARGVRAGLPPSPHDGYVGLLLWDVLPEIARRLGATLDPSESLDPMVRGASLARLRALASHCYQNTGRAGLAAAARPDGDLCPAAFLTREAANGNPMAIALDRVAPPGPGAEDFLARHMLEISRVRGHAPARSWHPGLQGVPAPEAGDAHVPAFA